MHRGQAVIARAGDCVADRHKCDQQRDEDDGPDHECGGNVAQKRDGVPGGDDREAERDVGVDVVGVERAAVATGLDEDAGEDAL